MVEKVYIQEEINFDKDGDSHSSFDTNLLFAVNRVKGISNPYIGNKRKILFWIIKSLDEKGIKYNSVIDLFAGSHCLSIVMKLLGKRVISNDLLYSSHIFGKAFVENNTLSIDHNDADFLLNNKSGFVPSFSQDSYSSMWEKRFTKREIEILDRFRFNVDYLFKDNSIKKALALANMELYIMDHCFVGGRLNNGQIIAEVKHRIKHARNRGSEMSFKDAMWHNFNEPFASNECLSICDDALTVLMDSCFSADLIYIDPPYGDQQSDYFSMYDFLYRFCTGDFGEIVKTKMQKAFVKSDQYENNFRKLIEMSFGKKPKAIAVSYNNSSWTGIDKISGIMKEYAADKKIDVLEKEYEYQYRDEDNKKGKEYLIVAS